MLQMVYRTAADKIAALLPPGIAPGKNPRADIIGGSRRPNRNGTPRKG